MAVAKVGSTGTKNDGGASATHTLAYDLNPSANFLDCAVGGYIDGIAIVGVTWNGTALTRIGTEVENADGRKLSAFRWDFANGAIATGTHNLVVTLQTSAAAGVLIEVNGWSGVDTTTPVNGVQTFATGGPGDTSSPTDIPSVTSATGDMVRGAVEAAFTTTFTGDGSPQVEDANFNDELFGSGRLATAHEPGSASVTLQWSFTPTINYSALAYNIVAGTSGVSIAPQVGSQPVTGRTPSMNFSINMPDVP
jgi:hypothetical protein